MESVHTSSYQPSLYGNVKPQVQAEVIVVIICKDRLCRIKVPFAW